MKARKNVNVGGTKAIKISFRSVLSIITIYITKSANATG